MSQVQFTDKIQNVEYLADKINAQDLNELKAATNSKADLSILKPVALTGSFNDLIDKPAIGGGNASINDGVVSPDSTYSSTKVENSLALKASRISGKIPLSELPDVNLIQYFDSAQFSVVDGKITFVGSGTGTPSLPAAAAPTNGVVNDSANTFGFTLNPSYPNLSDYEYQINSGTITTVSANPISIGDIASNVGGVRCRVKAVSGVSSASAWLTNATAYTATPGLTTPAAPTAGIVNDTANTFSFTLNPSYPNLSQYEYQIGSGTINTVTSNGIAVGDISAAVGTVKVRVKAVSGVSNVSAWLTNLTAFIGTVQDNLTPLTSWYLDPSLSLTGTDGNNLVFNAAIQGGYGQTWARMDAEPNAIFTVQMDSPLTANGGALSVDPTENDGNNDVLLGAAWSRGSSNTNGRWSLRINGVSFNGTNKSFAAGIIPKGRFRSDGARLYFEESFDNGATWIDVNPTAIAAVPSTPLHVKTFYGDSGAINNIRYTGLVARID